MSKLTIDDLTQHESMTKRSMARVNGGLCLPGTGCGPADEPLPPQGPDVYSPGLPDIEQMIRKIMKGHGIPGGDGGPVPLGPPARSGFGGYPPEWVA